MLAKHWADGGAGAEQLAQQVITMLDEPKAACQLLYSDDVPLWDKMKTVATELYAASDIVADQKVHNKLKRISETHAHVPVCMAKTPYSFSADPSLRGAASNHVLTIRDVKLSRGAEFVVALCGDIMTMPGLPKVPASERIDVNSQGEISGLF